MTDWSAALQQAFATHVKTSGSSGSCGSSVRMPSKNNKLPCADLGPTRSKLVGLVAPPPSAGATEPLREPRVATVVGSEKETSDQLLDRSGATGATRATREQGSSVSTQLDEERIAILEIDGNIPSAYAETFARLDAECPHDLEHDRRRGIVDDAGRFLDRWGHEAERLQWSTVDLFGSECLGAPEYRLGVIPLIDGGHVVSLEPRQAVIETGRGGTVIYMRKAPGAEP